MDEVRNLFQNWFGQLVERIVRLDQYLSERKASAPTRVKLRRNIVSELLSSLHQLAEELHEKATFFLSDKSPESRRSIYYAFVLEATGRYRRLHALINYIPAPWPSPHLELFLTKVLEEGGLEGSCMGKSRCCAIRFYRLITISLTSLCRSQAPVPSSDNFHCRTS